MKERLLNLLALALVLLVCGLVIGSMLTFMLVTQGVAAVVLFVLSMSVLALVILAFSWAMDRLTKPHG